MLRKIQALPLTVIIAGLLVAPILVWMPIAVTGALFLLIAAGLQGGDANRPFVVLGGISLVLLFLSAVLLVSMMVGLYRNRRFALGLSAVVLPLLIAGGYSNLINVYFHSDVQVVISSGLYLLAAFIAFYYIREFKLNLRR